MLEGGGHLFSQEPLFKRLKSVQAENKSKADARTTRSAIASDADGADDLGMVI